MPYYPDQHHRRSIRLPHYDYSLPGAYFVTLCSEQRLCLFGDVNEEGRSCPNAAGEMLGEWWTELKRKFPGLQLDGFVAMPNHVHGIIVLGERPVGADLRVCPPVGTEAGQDSRTDPPVRFTSPVAAPAEGAHAGAPLRGISPTRASALGGVVQWYKTMTTNAYIRGVKEKGWPRFPGRLWQRNYYEHVIRDEEEMARARTYIDQNPLKWHLDRENPARVARGAGAH